MNEKRYIRLTTEGMKWSDQVAEVVEEFDDTKSSGVRMYSFLDTDGYIHFIPNCEAEFITKKEYFTAVLQGKLFGG